MRLLSLAILALSALAAPVLAQDGATTWNETGVAALQAGQLDKAIDSFSEAYKLDRDDLTVQINLSRAFGHRAKARYEAGRIPEALADLESGRAVHRDGGSLEVMAAHIQVSMGQRKKALVLVDGVLRDMPQQADAILLRAELHNVAGELNQAVALLEKAVKQDGENKRLAERLQQLKEEQEAWRDFLTDNSSHFDFRYDPRRPAIVNAIDLLGEDLEAAYQRVVSELGLEPPSRILVLVLDRERYKGDAPEWSGGLYDGRIRIAVGDYVSERVQLSATLRHEYTHAALHGLGPHLPTWFHEGLAQWVEGRPPSRARRHLEGLDKLPDLDGLAGNWTQWTDRDRVLAAYEYSLSFCAWLREEYGSDAYALMFRAIPSQGFENAIFSTLGRSLADLDQAHREFLGAQ